MKRLALAVCAIPAAFVLSAWLYYPLLWVGERLRLWGDPPKGDVLGIRSVFADLCDWAAALPEERS
jgi:hypothetical protein